MNLTEKSLIIGLAAVVIYSIVYAIKRKQPPNLGALFVLFMCGPVVEEAWSIIHINWQIFGENKTIDTGVFGSHLYVIAFCAIALIYSVVYTIFTTFTTIPKASDS